MCGIIGYRGEDAREAVLQGLENLEYRGYDSAGVTLLNAGSLKTVKAPGEVAEVKRMVQNSGVEGEKGIGHTRWATHGGVTRENAHPHTSCDGGLVIAHNGIVENFEEMKESLGRHEFESETDSEVIAHFLEERMEEGLGKSIEDFMEEAEGAMAVAGLISDGRMFGFRTGSPLAVGVGEGESFISSDVSAFSERTGKAAFLRDGEYVIFDGDIRFFREGERIEKEFRDLGKMRSNGDKGNFDHFMRKEIQEQPVASRRLLESLENSQEKNVRDFLELIEENEKVIFTGAGTSYHATLLGVYFLQRAGVEAQTLIASEFQNYERVDGDTLLVAVSQSGETRDTLDAIGFSRDEGASIASIVNNRHSEIWRESDASIEIKAGKEVCVAATKTFTNTVLALQHLADSLGYQDSLEKIPDRIENVIEKNEGRVKEIARQLKGDEDVYIIGRGSTYPVAREIALKLKEVPYVHAEGMMGGELKHGTLALIEEGTPIIALILEEDDEIVSNVHELEARGANVIKISPHYGGFELPEGNGGFPLYATTLGFLLSYHLGRERDCPIDKPRNLAKTVTVR